MKRHSLILAGLLVGILGLAIIGGSALAQESDADDDSTHTEQGSDTDDDSTHTEQGSETDADTDDTIESFASRVATILNLDESAVEDAIDQAKSALFLEKLNEHLAAATEAGKITQDEADTYAARAADADENHKSAKRGHLYCAGGADVSARVAEILGQDATDVEAAFQQAGTALRADIATQRRAEFQEMLTARLAAAVEAGKITQAQADEYTQWLADRPEGIDAIGLMTNRGRGFHGQRGPYHPRGESRPDRDVDNTKAHVA